MVSQSNSGPIRGLYNALQSGRISRRQFMERSTMAGVSAGMAVFLANTAQVGAQDASPAAEASPAAQSSVRPTGGTENQSRGEGGDLRILQWQAPSLLSPFNASGVKDYLASVLVLEPLMHYMTDATLIPNLIKEVPTFENGLLAEDLTSVTYNLLEGVTWSDGTPFTANDVRFTWEWQLDAEGTYGSNSVSIQVAETISDIEVVDDLTAIVHFHNPNPLWFENNAGTSTGFVYPKHILEAGPDALQGFLSSPVGTGPYVVESFAVNDQVIYAVNENYREANKPFFNRVTIKGGGDAASAARAVLQTGDYDFAWNLQVEPDVLEGMVAEDNPGYLLVALGTNVERIDLNFADPNTEVDGQRAEVNTPHPFFSDMAVREALTLAIDRETIANSFYEGGEEEPAAANLLEGIAALESPNNEVVYDPERAGQILDEAGWTLDGDVRSKDGVELSVKYATSVNQVRQKTQAVVKDNLEAIGFKVELISVDAGIYFDTAPGNEQNIYKFYWDMEMFQSVPTNPTPITYMENWYAGADNSNVSQASNQWTGGNTMRYVNPDYDALLDQARTETDPEALANLFIEMNDILISNYVSVPLVRVGSKNGVSYTLNEENLELGPFSYHYWNIANWNRKPE